MRAAGAGPDPRSVLRWCRENARDMTRLLEELATLESPSDAPGAVAAVADRLATELRRLDLAVELVPVEGTGPILRARASAQGGGTMLLGHLDTVWPLGTLAHRPLRHEGECLYGPGAFDMKGGLVVIVSALRCLRAHGVGPAVTVFLTPREEVGCQPYREVMEAEMRACSACLCFEPAWPGGAVKTARKGSGTFLVRALGKAAHAGANPEKGASAVLEVARQCLAVSALTDASEGVSVNVGVVRGGLRANIVPDQAEAEVDVRYLTARQGEALVSRLRALRAQDPRVRLEVEGGLGYPPLERTSAVAALFETARRAAEDLGTRLEEVATGGASEASFAAALGLPTLDGLGPDGDGAHAVDEHVLLPSLPERAALAALLISRL